MALPRRIVPGTTYMITRRCYQRTFRLRPSDVTNGVFLYSLAWAAEKTGVEIHAACMMSNHHHVVLTDVRGTLPDFVREFHRTVAKALNATQGQWENLWSSEPYHSLELAAEEDIIDKVAYVAANPTEAGLVQAPEEWPGVMLLPGAEVKTTNLPRPSKYFTSNDAFPEVVTLRVMPIPAKTRPELDALYRVSEAIEHAVARARTAILACGRTFLGRDAVLGQSFQKRAKSFEPRRGPIPKVRARNRTLLKAMIARYAVFWAAYREALEAWRGGNRGVVFPFGTWAMRVFHSAMVGLG